MAVAVQRSPDGYAYLDLSRARDAVSQYQNFYGVVTDWDAARKSRGSAGDWFCNFYLKDVTLDDTQVVKLRVFGRDLAQLPHPRRTGDIIRIHRARVSCLPARPILPSPLPSSGSCNAAEDFTNTRSTAVTLTPLKHVLSRGFDPGGN